MGRRRFLGSVAASALLGRVAESESFLSPMVRLVSLEGERPGMLALLGRFDEALATANAIYEQLQPPLDVYMYVNFPSL